VRFEQNLDLLKLILWVPMGNHEKASLISVRECKECVAEILLLALFNNLLHHASLLLCDDSLLDLLSQVSSLRVVEFVGARLRTSRDFSEVIAHAGLALTPLADGEG